MTDHPFCALPDRGKEPTSKRHLDAWIQQAQPKTGVAVGRLGWLVASSRCAAVHQGAVVQFVVSWATYYERSGQAFRWGKG